MPFTIFIKEKPNLTPKSSHKSHPIMSGNRHRGCGWARFGVAPLVADKIRAVSTEICKGDAISHLSYRLRGEKTRLCWSTKKLHFNWNPRNNHVF